MCPSAATLPGSRVCRAPAIPICCPRRDVLVIVRPQITGERMVRTILVVMLCLLFAPVAQAQLALNLMPVPAKVQTGSGQLLIGPTFSVSIAGRHEPRLDRAVEIFLGQLGGQIGMPPIDMQVADSANATLVIRAANGSDTVQALGEDE